MDANRFLDSFKILSSGDPSWIQPQRKEAWDAFVNSSLPSTQVEEFRHTDLSKLKLDGFFPNGSDTSWVFNGGQGVILGSLSESLKTNPRLVEPCLGKISRFKPWKLRLLHNALWSGGLFLYVPKNVRLTEPIRASSLVKESGEAHFPHMLIILEEGSAATFINDVTTGSDGEQLVVSQCEIVLKPGSNLHYLNVQKLNCASWCFMDQAVELHNDARLTTLSLYLGGRITKSDVFINHVGRGSSSQILGIVFGDGEQHFNIQTFQQHPAPETVSDLLYKIILDEKASSIFKGLIRIEKGGQKSNAYQSNKNLLLSSKARVDSQPKLEIIADDVRCTHGATVGSVDENQLFYLMSRGLDRREAEKLIITGFCAEVCQRFGSPPVTEALMTDLQSKIG
ncbi:MAG: Fe-S cluster assembly protein SufD [Deltaproteobacteria bacterium RIFCSPHIGHO2_12_FULL_43_9]|nr:MAG: Fe-S cluster assembly protein SufD [Deltaproteobacteria bacterium RIFCSPHIGHO2_12_FULL_43_9]